MLPGVFDYHNQHAENNGEAIAGKISGTNIASAIAGIPTGPPAEPPSAMATMSFAGVQPATPSGAGTVFQGSKDSSTRGSQDIHDEKIDYSNHVDSSSHDAVKWDTLNGQPGGPSVNTDIGLSNDAKHESLVTNKDGNTDTTATSQSGTIGNIDVNSGNSASDIDFKNQSKSAKEEHQGNGVYEYHQQTSDSGSLSQTFNGDNAVQNAGKAYGDMVQSLGAGGHKAKREVDAASENKDKQRTFVEMLYELVQDQQAAIPEVSKELIDPATEVHDQQSLIAVTDSPQQPAQDAHQTSVADVSQSLFDSVTGRPNTTLSLSNGTGGLIDTKLLFVDIGRGICYGLGACFLLACLGALVAYMRRPCPPMERDAEGRLWRCDCPKCERELQNMVSLYWNGTEKA